MSLHTLVKVAGCGALLICGASSLTKWKIQKNLKEGVWFSESMRLLRAHQGAANLLGEPIVDGDLNLASPADNFCHVSAAQFRVPVRGPKETGYLYLWASRAGQWQVDRLELELSSDATRRLLVYNGGSGGNSAGSRGNGASESKNDLTEASDEASVATNETDDSLKTQV